jgi:putative integral membrane protein (TIGR02587 family)
LASGFLVGIPVVVTVDSWWLGEQVGPVDALVLLAVAYALTLATVYWIGFQRGLRRRWQHFGDALEALALATLALVAVFWVLGQIGDGQTPSIAVGRLAVAITPVSLGVAVANHLLARDGSRSDPDRDDASSLRGWPGTGGRRTELELAASVAGAFFLCVAVVPLDDLSHIATEAPVRHIPLVILLFLLVTYSVVFAAGFSGEAMRHATPGLLESPFGETLTAYVAAVVVSLTVLWVFGRVDGGSAPFEIYAKTVLLAFPASMAAAGRLAV